MTTIKLFDLFLVIPTSIAFALYRLLIMNQILRPISIMYQVKDKKKFINRGFDCIHYWTSTLLGIFSMCNRPYFHCTFFSFDCLNYLEYTGDHTVGTLFEKLYFYYFLSYYVSDILWLRSGKELFVMILHHFVTITLCVSTILAARPVLGLTLMLLHDIVDLFLYTGKIATYLKKKTIADVSFLIFAVLFFYLRIINLGYLGGLNFYEYKKNPVKQHAGFSLYSRSIIFVLYCCHIHWANQIFKAAKQVITGGKIGDTRSD